MIPSLSSRRRPSVMEDLQRRLRTPRKHNMGSYSNSILKSVNILKYDEGTNERPTMMIFSFFVTQDLCNGFDTLHGGAQAAAVDVFTSIVLHEVNPVPSVTTDLHVSYVSAAPIGSTVICICKADKPSGGLQFSSCDLYREVEECDGTSSSNQNRRILVAKGLHTKYILKKRTKGFDGRKQRSKL